MRVGIVGAGAIATGVHLPVLKAMRDLDVCWIADVNERAARDAATSFGVPAALPGAEPARLPPCDVVLLATPVHAREAYIREFAGRGTAIFSEKPFALSVAQHEAFLDLCGQLPVACGYMRRGYGSVRSLQTLVREQWFGPLAGIRYGEGGRVAKTGGGNATLDLSYKRGGGVLRDLGCHGLDAIQFITGTMAAIDVRSTIVWDEETDRDVRSRFTITIVDADGTSRECPVEFAVSWIAETDSAIRLDFQTTSVSCPIGPGDKLQVRGKSAATTVLTLSGDTPQAVTSYQAFYLEWRDFIDSIRAGRASEYSALSSLQTTRLVDAIYSSGAAP